MHSASFITSRLLLWENRFWYPTAFFGLIVWFLKPRMKKLKKCIICQREFLCSKYHPYQDVCSDKECQHKRQLLNQKKWRAKNPNYFKYKKKDTVWEKRRAQSLELWRQAHKEYFRNYRQSKKNRELNLEASSESGWWGNYDLRGGVNSEAWDWQSAFKLREPYRHNTLRTKLLRWYG